MRALLDSPSGPRDATAHPSPGETVTGGTGGFFAESHAQLGGCEYFALCRNPATHRRPHPAFAEGVPTCDACAAKVAAIEAGS